MQPWIEKLQSSGKILPKKLAIGHGEHDIKNGDLLSCKLTLLFLYRFFDEMAIFFSFFFFLIGNDKEIY